MSAVALATAAPAFGQSLPSCAGLLPSHADASTDTTRRLITAADLVALRDIGPTGAGRIAQPILSLSPDGKEIAFQIDQANASSNQYCVGIAVLDLVSGDVQLVDLGGELIKEKTGGEGFVPREAGFAKVVTPKWSPDGQWLAFLRRDDAVTQVWRVRTDGSQLAAVTFSKTDVEDFAWAADGRGIVFSTDNPVTGSDEEAGQGYLYDDRFDPAISNRPLARGPLAPIISYVDASTIVQRPASPEEQTLLAPPKLVPDSTMSARSVSGALAWVVSDKPGVGSDSSTLYVRRSSGLVRCDDCDGVAGLWWSGDGSRLYFLRKEPTKPELGLYLWSKDDEKPRRVMDTDDALIGCVLAAEKLVCADEASSRPRHVVSIELGSGQVQDLFDPNPAFQQIRLGRIQRLRWKNAFGLEPFGDLVFPPDYVAGKPYPLIVVGYDSRGFLRGGTGDDYPIQLFASHGFLVLSYQRPPIYGYSVGARSAMEAEQLGKANWSDYRNVLSSIEIEVQALIDQGVVDGARVGLTGFSNGASVAQFAMINSHLFKAFELSHCCEDPVSAVTVTGPVVGRWLEEMGYPHLTEQAEPFWSRMSIRLNAATLDAPLLLQVPDDEYLGALEGFTALREHDQPVELYVFPDEHHVKWQPSHRLAQYVRSVDWFDFWLRGVEDPDPLKLAQYQRWRALRDVRTK